MASKELPRKSRDEYRKLAHIGRGSFGDAFLCEHFKTAERLCMKEIDMSFYSTLEQARCLNEVKLLQHLPVHPNIVGFREAFWAQSDEESARILCLILEFADGGDLEQFLQSPRDSPIQEHEAHRIFKQLAQAVYHLHRYHVVHRDLKCGNVFLFNDGRVVLGDFGTSKLLPSSAGSDQDLDAQNLTSTVVGTPFYMSPELLEGEPYGFATDIWSLGCVLYELFSGGKPAFAASSYPAVIYRITQGQCDPLDPASASDEVQNLIASMLCKVPRERPSILEILQSPWLKLVDTVESSSVGDFSAARMPTNTEEIPRTAEDTTSVLQPTESDTNTPLDELPVSALPAPAERPNAAESTKVSTLSQALPPPAPTHRAVKHPRRHSHLQRQSHQHAAASPLVQLDIQPSHPPARSSGKRFSLAPSTPFMKISHVQSNPPALEVRGVHFSRAARPARK